MHRGEEAAEVYVEIGNGQRPDPEVIREIGRQVERIGKTTIVNIVGGSKEDAQFIEYGTVVFDRINYIPTGAKIMVANPTKANVIKAL